MCANRDENITALQRCGKVARKVLRCAGGGQPPDRSAASKAGKRQLLLAKPASVINKYIGAHTHTHTRENEHTDKQTSKLAN